MLKTTLWGWKWNKKKPDQDKQQGIKRLCIGKWLQIKKRDLESWAWHLRQLTKFQTNHSLHLSSPSWLTITARIEVLISFTWLTNQFWSLISLLQKCKWQTFVSYNRKQSMKKVYILYSSGSPRLLPGSAASAGNLLKMKILTQLKAETLGVGPSNFCCNKPFS